MQKEETFIINREDNYTNYKAKILILPGEMSSKQENPLHHHLREDQGNGVRGPQGVLHPS